MKKWILPSLLLVASAIFWMLILKNEFTYLLIWWAILLVIGLMLFPLSSVIFSTFTDKGYLFSKGLGLAVTSYAIYLLSYLKVLKLGTAESWGVVIGCGILVFLLFYKKAKQSLSGFLKNDTLPWILLGESLFLFSLGFWTYLRGFNARIEGLEKFMDYGFVNAILQSGTVPPKDMWFAGESINYYYFGQYVTAFITKLSGIKTEISYNLMMATLFAFSMALCFALVTNLLKGYGLKNNAAVISGGLLASVLVSLGGNLHSFIYGIFYKYTNKGEKYWFPDATRYIGYNPDTADKTIHEFPVYSFVVSDLHAHVINMIFVLTLLGILLAIFRKLQKRIEDGWQPVSIFDEIFFPELLLPGFLIGIFQMSNYWDFPIYLTVTLFVLLCSAIRQHQRPVIKFGIAAIRFVTVIILSLIFAFPFNSTFDKISTSIRFTINHSLPHQLLVLWGYQLVMVVIFFAFILYTEQNVRWKAAKGIERRRLRSELTLFRRIRKVLEKYRIEDVFGVILCISAIGLVFIPEIVYVVDIYSGEHKRANTMFKLTYQAFIMFGLASGYIFVRIRQFARKDWKVRLARILTVIMVALPMIYPFYAISSWYRNLDPKQYEGLDGLAFMKREYPDDYDLVMWIRENIEGQPNILEANGDSYDTPYERISMATGSPTIVGWYTHEWLWRDDNKWVQDRVNEVKTIYESEDVTQTVELLNKYQVEYIVIGQAERDKFPELKEDKLLSLGNVIFEKSTIKLIKLYQE